jgi:hypothetical protein
MSFWLKSCLTHIVSTVPYFTAWWVKFINFFAHLGPDPGTPLNPDPDSQHCFFRRFADSDQHLPPCWCVPSSLDLATPLHFPPSPSPLCRCRRDCCRTHMYQNNSLKGLSHDLIRGLKSIFCLDELIGYFFAGSRFYLSRKQAEENVHRYKM